MSKKVTIVSLLLALFVSCMTMFAITKVNVAKASATYNVRGMDFSKSNGYVLDDVVTGAPKTIEAFVKINDKTFLADKSYGVVFGNFISGAAANSDCIDLMVEAGGKPRLFYYNASYSGNNDEGVAKGFDFKTTYVLNPNQWYHLAFVRDTTAGKTIFYVDGVEVSSVNKVGDDLVPGSGNCGNLAIGQDKRADASNKKCFQGEIAYVAMSSEIKTQETLKADCDAMRNGEISKDNAKFNNVTLGDLLMLDYNSVHSYYRASEAFSATPNTITATIKVNKDYAVGNNGVIVGNGAVQESNHCFNIELNNQGYVCVAWNSYKSANTHPYIVFSGKDFRDGVKHHIAVVRDKISGVFRLYDNGTLIQTSSESLGVGDDIISTYTLGIGCDYRAMGGNRWPFKGYIYDVGVYSRALSTAEVVNEYGIADKTTITSSTISGLLSNYTFTEEEAKLEYDKSFRRTIKDDSENGNTLTLATIQHYYDVEKDWFKASDDEYSLVFMPDTQLTVSRDIQNISSFSSVADLDMTKTFQWIADNKDAMNLSFVMHMGDLKHARGVSDNWGTQNDWREWQLISGNPTVNSNFNTNTSGTGSTISSFDTMSGFDYSTPFGFEILKQAGIPYSIILGNHDYDAFYMPSGTGRTANYYNYYFSNDSYNEKFADNVVARYDSSNMMNVIYEFTSTTNNGKSVKYLVVALEFGPSDAMVQWANDFVSQEQYKNHRIIWNSHYLVYSDGTYATEDSGWNPDTYGYSQDYGIDTNRGGELFNEMISLHQNSFMAAGGHISIESVMKRVDKGVNGNEIFGMLFDMQDSFNNRGDSFILVAKVNEKSKKITFRLYNPVLNKFYGVENEFEYDFSNFKEGETQGQSEFEKLGVNENTLEVKSASVRKINDDYGAGIRFKTVIKKTDYDNLVALGETKFGTVICNKSKFFGALTKNTTDALVVDATNTFKPVVYDGVEYMESLAYAYDIPVELYADSIMVRSYVEYKEEIAYSALRYKSMTGVALDVLDAEGEDGLTPYFNLTISVAVNKGDKYEISIPYEKGFLPSVSVVKGIAGAEREGLVIYENGKVTYTVRYSKADVWDGSEASAFASGSGTKEYPYLISTGAQLKYLATQSISDAEFTTNKYFKLTSHIDLNGLDWTPISYTADRNNAYFKGVFDGNGFTIANLYLNDAAKAGVGLFAGLQNATVTNLTITGNITASSAGGLAYNAKNSTIDNVVSCVNLTLSNASDRNSGGIIGIAEENTIITNCVYLGDMKNVASANVGGIVGSAYNTTIEKCYNYGVIASSGEALGGIVGYLADSSSVNQCINFASISGTSANGKIGGIVGNVSNGLIVSECVNYATVSGTASVGGIVGNAVNATSDEVKNIFTISTSKNLGVIKATGNYLGGIVGNATASRDRIDTIGCENFGDVTGENSLAVGGIAGISKNSVSANLNVVDNCVNNGKIYGLGHVGGINGTSTRAYVTNSVNNGEVLGVNTSTGVGIAGISGWTTDTSKIESSVNNGNVKGYAKVGGISGVCGKATYVNTTDEGKICTNSGEITLYSAEEPTTLETGTTENNYVGLIKGQQL